MHPPSQRNKKIGRAGLIWFLFCTATAACVWFDKEGFRNWSHFTWTDRELAIGAACYFTAGLGGAVLAVTRLFLPPFARRPMIGYDRAAPLLAVDVRPSFEDFHALHARASVRAARTAILVTLLCGIALFVLLEHPTLRHEGVPLRVGLTAFALIIAAKVLLPLISSAVSRSKWWSILCWYLFGRHREPRRYHVFEDGILVQGVTFERVVPWYDVRYVHFFGDTIGLVGRGELMTIPTAALPSHDALAQLIHLLDRKAVYSAVDARRD
jgi:hypothetical protein